MSEKELSQTEEHIKLLAQTLSTTVTFVNLLIAKAGITNEELDQAIAEEAVRRVEEKRLRSQETGAAGDNSRIIDPAISGDAGTGDAARISDSATASDPS